jgi:hypothetical protein
MRELNWNSCHSNPDGHLLALRFIGRLGEEYKSGQEDTRIQRPKPLATEQPAVPAQMSLESLRELLPLVMTQLVQLESTGDRSKELVHWTEPAAHLQAAIWGLETECLPSEEVSGMGKGEIRWDGDILHHNLSCATIALEKSNEMRLDIGGIVISCGQRTLSVEIRYALVKKNTKALCLRTFRFDGVGDCCKAKWYKVPHRYVNNQVRLSI